MTRVERREVIATALVTVSLFTAVFVVLRSPAVAASTTNLVSNTTRSGTITKSEIWSGTIYVTGSIIVPKKITLTIKPGTTIKIKPSRDYKKPDKIMFDISGRLLAEGTSKKFITFTSAANKPQNGDWAMLHLAGKTKSRIKYAVVEFAQQGINVWRSDILISHSIIRWNNWEGLYAESYSTPTIEYNRVYQNGYNGMAMEQFNTAVLRNNIFEKNGTHGVHIDASTAAVTNNILRNNHAAGLSLDDISTVTAMNNTISGNLNTQIMCGEGDNKLTAVGNLVVEGETPTNCPDEAFVQNTPGAGAVAVNFGYSDHKKYDLGYTPGDHIKDRYQYVYPNDKTRKIINKIGTGLGLAWSVTLEGSDVWAATVSGDVYKLNGQTGEILKQFKAPSSQPWGMAWDGQQLWITDFAEKRTYSLDPDTGEETFSFNNPDQVAGAKGLTWDGAYLYIMGWTTNTICKVDRTGAVISTIKLNAGGGGGLTWDGHNFWAPCDGICKYSPTGKLLGKIYPASEGTWDLAWEPANNKYGGYLWASQRTNENWYDDAKIYKLEILNDQVAL